jgi:hypothetical protein
MATIFGRDVHPVGHRGGVDDLVHPALAVAPDQLAGIEARDEDDEEGVGAFEGLHHQARRRDRTGCRSSRRQPHAADRVQQADPQQHEERGTAEDEAHVHAGEREQLRARRARGTGGDVGHDVPVAPRIRGDDAAHRTRVVFGERLELGAVRTRGPRRARAAALRRLRGRIVRARARTLEPHGEAEGR